MTPEEQSALSWAYALLARAFAPPQRLSVAEWAEGRRVVSADSGTPFDGPWRHARTPHLVEVMETLSPEHPATDVYVRKSAQTGFTEAAVNWIGHTIDAAPAPMIYILPTLEQAVKFNRAKLEPMIAATPSVRAKVVVDRESGKGSSTATFKRFPGGFLVVANAHSSSQLQMLSAKNLACDEVSEYPAEAGQRGDPVKQAVARTLAFTRQRPKRFYFSTPQIVGSCRIHAGFEASDQRKFYVPCPECGHFQSLEWDRLRWERDEAPHGAWFECAAHGCVIEYRHLDRMVQAEAPGEEGRGVGRLWIKTYVDDEDPDGNPAPPRAIAPEDFARWRKRPSKGRAPGFAFWQATSRLANWEGIVSEYLASRDSPQKMRAFVQQVRGEAWEEKGDAPDDQKLLLMARPHVRGHVPPGLLVLTGAVDVQGDRLEWAVYAWGPEMRSGLVDWGVVVGDTDQPETWAGLDAVRERAFPDQHGQKWRCDLWFVDAGFRSHRAYRYCQSRGGLQGSPPIAPIMGDASDHVSAQLKPILSTPRAVSYDWEGRKVEGGIRYDLGTWALKSELYAGLRRTLEGPDPDGRLRPGAILFARECDADFFGQITAEAIVTETDRAGRTKRAWKKIRPRNEQLDLWCYARAAAEMLELPQQDAAFWEGLARERGPRQADLLAPAAGLEAEARRGGEGGAWVTAGPGWVR